MCCVYLSPPPAPPLQSTFSILSFFKDIFIIGRPIAIRHVHMMKIIHKRFFFTRIGKVASHFPFVFDGAVRPPHVPPRPAGGPVIALSGFRNSTDPAMALYTMDGRKETPPTQCRNPSPCHWCSFVVDALHILIALLTRPGRHFVGRRRRLWS